MDDKTTPLPAPDGLKWVVYRASTWERDGYGLGLFPEDADVNEKGLYTTPHPGDRNFKKGAPIPHGPKAMAYFWRENQIRRASAEVLKSLGAERAERSLFDRLRKAYS